MRIKENLQKMKEKMNKLGVNMLYKENLELYKKCLEIFDPFKGAPGNFKFAENTDEYLPFIVEYFQESGIMEKLFGKKNKYIKESKN